MQDNFLVCETERPLKMLKSKPSDFFSKIYYLFNFFLCVCVCVEPIGRKVWAGEFFYLILLKHWKDIEKKFPQVFTEGKKELKNIFLVKLVFVNSYNDF